MWADTLGLLLSVANEILSCLFLVNPIIKNQFRIKLNPITQPFSSSKTYIVCK